MFLAHHLRYAARWVGSRGVLLPVASIVRLARLVLVGVFAPATFSIGATLCFPRFKKSGNERRRFVVQAVIDQRRTTGRVVVCLLVGVVVKPTTVVVRRYARPCTEIEYHLAARAHGATELGQIEPADGWKGGHGCSLLTTSATARAMIW